MSGDPAPYLALITSQHAGAQNFVTMVGGTVQPFADEQALLSGLPALFDLDAAVGVQLDVIGLWAGVTRFVANTTLSDSQFRTLVRARIVRNHWDGTVPGAYRVWDTMFASTGAIIFIVDHQDMTMDLGLAGPIPDVVTISLLTGGYLSLRPAGVHINGYYYPTVPGPLFAWDTENSIGGGWDEAGWAAYVPAA